MTFYQYIFRCNLIPSKLTFHSLSTNFLNNGNKDISDIDFKIESEGKLISIKTNKLMDVEDNLKYVFFDKKYNKEIEIYFIKKDLIPLEKYENGQIVNISGIIEYYINSRIFNKKLCPFFNGRFVTEYNGVKTNFREFLKNDIENTCGVKILEFKNENFQRLLTEVLTKKITLHNMIRFDLPVEITNLEKFNSLQFKSIFRKKSYGLGNIRIYK